MASWDENESIIEMKLKIKHFSNIFVIWSSRSGRVVT